MARRGAPERSCSGGRDGEGPGPLRILALVTARGGSKRIPGKNLRLLGGRPLITWTLDAAKEHAVICETLVSTDDEAIATVAREAGALVPWLRPSELAADTAASIDIVLHGLAWYEDARGAVDGVLLLQPTSPFRRRETVARGFALFERLRRPVIGVSPAPAHPTACYRVDGDTMMPFMGRGAEELRSQDLEPAYVVNGSFYLIAPTHLRRERSFYGDTPVPLIAEGPEEVLDIDTEWDWQFAEAMLSLRVIPHSPPGRAPQ